MPCTMNDEEQGKKRSEALNDGNLLPNGRENIKLQGQGSVLCWRILFSPISVVLLSSSLPT